MTLSRLIRKGTQSRISVWLRMNQATRAMPTPAPARSFTSCSSMEAEVPLEVLQLHALAGQWLVSMIFFLWGRKKKWRK